MTDEGGTTNQGRIAGIDYGTVRVGVAVTDREQRIASPLDNYQRRGAEADANYFRAFVADHDVVLFVVGLPVHLSGHESEKSREARKFGTWLGDTTGVPCVFFDERFTTAEAEAHLAQAGLSKAKRKARLDKLAAQIMLTAYLESPHAANRLPSPLDD